MAYNNGGRGVLEGIETPRNFYYCLFIVLFSYIYLTYHSIVMCLHSIQELCSSRRTQGCVFLTSVCTVSLFSRDLAREGRWISYFNKLIEIVCANFGVDLLLDLRADKAKDTHPTHAHSLSAHTYLQVYNLDKQHLTRTLHRVTK